MRPRGEGLAGEQPSTVLRVGLVVLASMLVHAPACAGEPPRTVGDLWAGFDPRAAPLDAEVVREWKADGIVLRHVTFSIGSFAGVPARMAAFLALPEHDEKVPGLLHLHGGGQRASIAEVAFHAARGYACLSLNWGGRPMEDAAADAPNTDWGAVDPTQRDPSGYFDLRPRAGCPDPFDSPRNNHWYLLTIGARRGLTYLERQPQVDPGRLGVYGHSMGGSLTVYVAGSDDRVKVAVPSCGGSGFRTAPWPHLPVVTLEQPLGDPALFTATLGLESFAPRITAPLLWLGATNDFHGIMDDTYRTGALVPPGNVRYAFTSHTNHRLSPDVAVTRSLWFDQTLRDGAPLPATPATVLAIETKDGVPELRVAPDRPDEVVTVRIHASEDPDPRARFWRSEAVMRDGAVWRAPLPVSDIDAPLFAFAEVTYGTEAQQAEPFAPHTDRFTLSSLLHSVAAGRLRRSGVEATGAPSLVVDDFVHGWEDWYRLEPANPHHWEFSTRKVGDPRWRGPEGSRLSIDVEAENDNELVVILTENVFRFTRGPQREFVATALIRGGHQRQTVSFSPADFTAADGTALAGWSAIDLLSLRAWTDHGGTIVGSKSWAGSQPLFRRVAWSQEASRRP